MSRYVHKEEEKLIYILEQYVPEERVAQITNTKRRIFLSKIAYSLIEKAHLFISDKINEFCVVLLEYDKKSYICMRKELFTEGILHAEDEVKDEEMLFGIGILLANNSIIQIKKEISGYQIFDKFFAFDEDMEYNCKDIFNLLEPYLVFKISEYDFVLKYKEDLSRILFALLVKSDFFYQSKEFADITFDIFTLESSRCIVSMFDTILRTQKNDIVFLQLYRCCEYLYIIQRAWYICEKYNMEIKDALNMLNNENIRYPEASSMKDLILKYCSNDIIDEYYDYLKTYTDLCISNDENKKKKVAEYIYNTR